MSIELDADIVCLTCKTFFTIHDFGKHVIREPGAGYHISGIECPNCRGKNLDFDIMSVEKNEENSSQTVVEFRLKERSGLIPLPMLLKMKAEQKKKRPSNNNNNNNNNNK
jgi:hypothetical protein